uniref:Uncharacterized protein n=1 Tax=Rhizophora mucronata TaxID=61149 RepID=A0A2P2NTG0_RHIMU
MQNEINKIKF